MTSKPRNSYVRKHDNTYEKGILAMGKTPPTRPSSGESDFVLKFADHAGISEEMLNQAYGNAGRTFKSNQRDAAIKYKDENPGSFFYVLWNYPEGTVHRPLVPGTMGVPQQGAEKYIRGYLVSTPNRTANSVQLYNTLHLVKN